MEWQQVRNEKGEVVGRYAVIFADSEIFHAARSAELEALEAGKSDAGTLARYLNAIGDVG